MITVITNEGAAVSNKFPGMSLAEACDQVVLECERLANDFQMNILLSEHAYLYENGIEMEYVDEAGKLNEKWEQVKAWAKNAIVQAKQKISDLFDTCMAWVAETVQKLLIKLKSAGITEKMLDKIFDLYDDTNPVEIELPREVTNRQAFYKALTMKEVGGIFIWDKDQMAQNPMTNVFEALTQKGEKRAITSEDILCIKDDLFGTAKKIGRTIYTSKKAANAALDGVLKSLDTKNEDDAQGIKNISAAIKQNSINARDAIKVFHLMINNSVKMAQAILKSEKYGKAIKEGLKADNKAAREARVAQADADKAAKKAEKEAEKANKHEAKAVAFAKNAAQKLHFGKNKAEEE